MDHRALVLQRHRHLKWRALDPVEAVLMVLCGVSIAGFTASVLADVVTRTIGHPWLWLQQVTTGFFAYGAFIGMAAATRRLDHLFLSEITRRAVGRTRAVLEAFNRLVVLAVAVIMVWFGYKNFLLDLGSFRMPSMIPLGTYTAIVPLVGILIALFAIEQLVNGLRHGFEGPEDTLGTGEPVE
ncbi:MAG TPA: TRAP transporter small permease subunit [Methylomirabilota bacterium]|nr:TRAP transporter small permease subunit [Methylomirabilota bacterium]